MIRAVLDTNVIVSSFLHPTGIPDRIIHAWKANLFDLCVSEPLFHEIEEVLNRPVIRRATRVTGGQIVEFLELLAETAILVEGPLIIQTVIADDPDDDVVLATALAVRADAIVSGDHHLLSLKGYEQIPIVNPRSFLDLLGNPVL